METSQIIFSKVNAKNDYSLYELESKASNQANFLNYLSWRQNGQIPGGQLSFSDALELSGVFLFSKSFDFAKTTDPEKLFLKLNGPNPGVSIFWLTNPDINSEDFSFTGLQIVVPTLQRKGRVEGNVNALNLEVANFGIVSSSAATLIIDSSTQSANLFITDEQQIKIAKDLTSQVFLNVESFRGQEPSITIPFNNNSTAPPIDQLPDVHVQPRGTLQLKGKGWPFHNLYYLVQGKERSIWGGMIKFHYPSSSNGNADQQLQYPLFGPALPELNAQADFNVRFDPLYVEYPSRFYFLSSTPLQAADIFQPKSFSIIGDLVTWKPIEQVGFYMTSSDTPDDPFYLSPLGKFSLELPSSLASTKYMPGLSAMEFMYIGKGLMMELVPNQPAYAGTFDPEKINFISVSSRFTDLNHPLYNQQELLLTNKTLTTWMRLWPKSTSEQWSYFSQPLSSSNYTKNESSDSSNFPIANVLSIKIGDFPSPRRSVPPAFPMGPYWNIFNEKGSPNKKSSIDCFSKFEKQILTPSRFNLLSPDAENDFGPVYSNVAGTPLAGNRVITSNGFIVNVNKENIQPDTDLNGNPLPPPGTSKQMVLARSNTDEILSFNANEKGIVDPKLVNALMNNQSFIVMNDWESGRFPLSKYLTISGFTFNIDQITVGETTIVPIMIFKFAESQSLLELINNPDSWTEPNHFLKDGDISNVLKALQKAIEITEKTKGKAEDPFGYFREVILNSENWTGILVFNCPLDGSNMPEDFKMLLAGINGALTAHHMGVELNQVGERNSDPNAEEEEKLPNIKKSSLFGVIYYEDQGNSDKDAVTVNCADPSQENFYKFIVQELIVVFQNSTITAFNSSVGLMVNCLFNRATKLLFLNTSSPTDGPETESNTFYVRGRYQKHGSTGTVTFTSEQAHLFDFNPEKNYTRVIDQFMVKGASLVPVGSEEKADQQIVRSRFSVNGELLFSSSIVPNDPNIPDIFSYGITNEEDPAQNKGLPVSGLAFNIQVALDENGQPIQSSRSVKLNMSNLAVQENKAAIREEGLINGMPFKLAGMLHATSEKGLEVKKLGQTVNVIQLTSNGTTQPGFALKFELPLGSLGSLAEAGASIDSFMIMSWGPNDSTPDNDGVSLFIQLPEASVGLLGFTLEGIVKTVFGDANLMKVKYQDRFVFALLFNNVAISIFGIKLPPKVITNFIVFSDPENGAGSNMAWNVAAIQTS